MPLATSFIWCPNAGADEHGLITTGDYVGIIRAAAAKAVQPTADQTQLLVGGQHLSSGDSATTLTQPAAAAQQRDAMTGSSSTMTPLATVSSAFTARVVLRHADVSISTAHLLALLNSATGTNRQDDAQDQAARADHRSASRGEEKEQEEAWAAALACVPHDAQLTALLQLGVVARHPQDDNTLLLTCPGVGALVKAVLAGVVRRPVQCSQST